MDCYIERNDHFNVIFYKEMYKKKGIFTNYSRGTLNAFLKQNFN